MFWRFQHNTSLTIDLGKIIIDICKWFFFLHQTLVLGMKWHHSTQQPTHTKEGALNITLMMERNDQQKHTGIIHITTFMFQKYLFEIWDGRLKTTINMENNMKYFLTFLDQILEIPKVCLVFSFWGTRFMGGGCQFVDKIHQICLVGHII